MTDAKGKTKGKTPGKSDATGKADKVLNFVNDDGAEFMKLVVDVTVYWVGSAYPHRDGLLHFYKEALAVIKDRLKFYLREDTESWKPITADVFKQLPDWLAGSDRSKETFAIDLQGGTDPTVPSDVAFRFFADEDEDGPAGSIRLVLPTTFGEETPAELLKLALSLPKEMHFHSGHAGYSINYDHLGDLAYDADVRMGILARRFPAIDLPAPVTTLMALPGGMKRIGWITLIGDDLMKEKEISAADLKGLEVHKLPHGIAVVAGDKPLLGDVNRKEDLSAYRKVGKALKSLRTKDHAPFVAGAEGVADDERSEQWLAYFDK
jgi:hypothetical protein